MKPEKQAIEKEYRDRLSRAASLVVTELQGFSAQSLYRLRRQLAGLKADYLVVTNRILRRALDGSRFAALSSQIRGESAVALGRENLPEVARILLDFEKAEGTSFLRAAMWENLLLTAEGIRQLARLPPRDQLLAQVATRIQAPLAGVVAILQRLLTGLVGVLSEISKKSPLAPSA